MGDFHSSPKKYICFSFDLLPRIRITKSTTYAISENHINKISKFLSNITNKRSIFTIYIKKREKERDNGPFCFKFLLNCRRGTYKQLAKTSSETYSHK